MKCLGALIFLLCLLTLPSAKVKSQCTSDGGKLSVSDANVCGSKTVTLELSHHTGTILSWEVRTQDNAADDDEGNEDDEIITPITNASSIKIAKKKNSVTWSEWTVFSTEASPIMEYMIYNSAFNIKKYQFRCLVQTESCTPSFSKTKLVISRIAGSSDPALSLSSTSVCDNGTVTLTASNYTGIIKTWEVSHKDGTDSWTPWTIFSTENIVSKSYTVTSNGVADRQYKFRIQTKNGNCEPISSITPKVFVYVTGATTALEASTTGAAPFSSSLEVCGSGAPTITLALPEFIGTVTAWQFKTKDGNGAWTSWSDFSNTNATHQSYQVSSAGSSNRNYKFRAHVNKNGCLSQTSSEVSVTVYAPSAIGTLSVTPLDLCVGNTVTLKLSSANSGNLNWQVASKLGGDAWPAMVSFSDEQATTLSYPVSNESTQNKYYSFQVSASNGICPAAISNKGFVTVKPAVTGTASNKTICSRQSTALPISSTIPGTTFSWIVKSSVNVSGANSGDGLMINQTLFNTTTLPGRVTYSITPSSDGCVGNSFDVTITVNPEPTVIGSGATICSGEAANIALSSNIHGTTFSWTISTGSIIGASAGTGTVINQSLTNISATEANVIYSITPSLNACTGSVTSLTVKVMPTIKATVSVTNSDLAENECSSNPDATVQCNKLGIYPGGFITLTATTANGVSFQWNKDNTPIAGATLASYTLTEPGYYTVTFTNGSSTCPFTSPGYDVKELSSPPCAMCGNDGLFSFPNPAGNEFMVRLQEPAMTDVFFSLIDLSGKEVMRNLIVKGKSAKTVSTQTLKDGLYVIRVNLNGKIETLKIFIVH
jgi:hypothetical protein